MNGSKWLKAIFVLVAIFLAAVLFEFLQRAFLNEPENLAKLRSSVLFLYENIPNKVFTYESDEFKNEISINSYGFRDSEFKRDKESGIYRIAVLGDSQEEALQVELSDTWQKVMARKLSEELGRRPDGSAWRVETYNFGVSGYGMDQKWLTLREKVWQFSPDMIILAFSPNDVGDTYKNKLVRIKDEEPEVISAKERAGGNFLGKIVRETYTYHLVVKAASTSEVAKRIVEKIRTKVLGFPKEERFFLSDAQLVEGPFEVIASQENPPKEVLDAWELVKVLVFDMKRQADEHKAEFLITVDIPRAQVQPEGWEFLGDLYNLDPKSSSPFEINKVIGKIAKDIGAYFYDPRLAAIEWKEKTGDLHWPIDAHFNVNGNLFMGTKVAEFIVKEGLIE